MGLLCVPKASRQMQRTLKNLRVSLLCFLLTFLMLRNTIGAGKFGTPAQDFEEIRQHLHHVGLHRRHVRVLTEAVEEEKQRISPLLKIEGMHRGEGEEDKQRRTLWLEEEVKQRNAPFLAFKGMQGNAALLAVDVKHGDTTFLAENPLERSHKVVLEGNVKSQKGLEGSRITSWNMQRKIKEENIGLRKDLEGSKIIQLQKEDEESVGFQRDLEGSRITSWDVQKKNKQGNVGFQKDLEGSRIISWDVQRRVKEGNEGFQKDLGGSRLVMQRKIKEAVAHSSYGDFRVLLIAELPSSGCKNPAREHLLLKSLKNKVDYSTLHGLEISVSFGALDPHVDGPLSKFSLLQSSMAKYHHAEWLWWVPIEALITDMAYELPLHNYAEFNIVLLGPHDLTRPRRSSIDLNTDTFLIRNCQWSLDLLRKCAKMGSAEGSRRDVIDSLLTNSLIKRPHIEAGGQSPLIFFSNQEEKFWADKESSVVLCDDWRCAASEFGRMVKQPQRGNGERGRVPFVTHFLGCKLCNEVGDNEGGWCMRQMERALDFADKQVMQNDGLASGKPTII